MATIKDVARLAGVSTSTVSRTLSGKVFVEEETRSRVMAAVEELGYRPSILAKALKEGRSYTIAFLIPDINSLFYPQFMHHVENYASVRGFTTLLCNSNGSKEKERQNLEMLAARGIDGIICMSVEDDVSHLTDYSKNRGIPVVLINRSTAEPLSQVSVDHETGSYLVTKHLLDQGHRRIAGIFGPASRKRFRMRHAGYVRALMEAGLDIGEERFVFEISTVEQAYHCAAKMLRGEEPPTAFFCSMDVLALGVYRAVREKGLRVPQDVMVAGFDNLDITEYMMPPLTTCAEPADEMARLAVQYLLEQMDHPEKRSVSVLQGELVFRGSTNQ